jgi:beta-lactamase regulating signal transducer with metallopeptidase domain
MARSLIESLAIDGPAQFVADTVIKATVLLCLAVIAAAVLRRSSAAVRHRLWALTLCGLLVLPALSWALPGWRLPILPATAGSAGSGVPRAESVGADTIEPPHALASAQPAFNAGRPEPGPAGGGPGTPLVSPRLVWTMGFLAAAMPALAGIVANEWRRRRSRPVTDPGWLESLETLADQLAIRRRVELRTIPASVIPTTWGILWPVILLPEGAREWPEALRRLVLLHELAHIRRGDVGFQLAGRMAAAAYWFHPLAWYALHRMRVECECACDDHVVHAGGRRTDYARQLVDLARSLRASARIAAVSMVRENTLEHRIKTLFDEGHSHKPLSHCLGGSLLVGALALLIGLAVVHPGASATVAPAPVNPPAVPQDPALPQTYTYPITITGRAVDPDGKPVAGARIYLASRRADYKRVAETVADAEGRYAFRDVELPIERARTVNGRDEGAFQVFGQAEGFGFAWRPQKWFYPLPKPPSITYEPEWRDPPGHYQANDRIELDLRFPPVARFSGTVVDDRGNRLAGVRLEIRNCESLTVVDNVRPGWTLDALNEHDSAPPSMKIRTTGADGRFEFTGMPENCRFRIDVRAKGFPDRWIHAATTRAPQPPHDGGPVFTGDFKLTLTTPVDVPIKMVYGDTREPAPKVAVQAVEGLVNILRTTDDQGRVTLTLPPGHYRMENWPARGTPYLVTDGELVVAAKPSAEPVALSLRPAAIVEVTVVDAETEAGIPEVDLWERTGPGPQREKVIISSWEVATRIAWRESPRTDARGKLRALVEPGKHRFGVGWQSFPRGFEAFEDQGQEVECRAGETLRLKFAMRPRR